MKIKEIMNNAIAVDHDMSLKEAAKIMSDKNIGSLVVVKEDKILGILTERDIMINVANIQKRISAIMAKQIVTIDQGDDMDDAAMIMAKHKIKHLPVVNKDGKLAGIITATDLIAHSDDLNEDFFFE